MNRRTFLAASAAAGATPTLLIPTAAKAAVDPATVVMIAQAGLQLYSMMKGSGPGQGDLLRAQTEMLRAISQQITFVVNNHFNV